jgi:glutamate-1-semialdehyde 2,1-aminomutase
VAAETRYRGSIAQLERARKTLAGGISSAMRAAQRPTPIVVERAYGSRLEDVDGNTYLDYVLGFGPMLLGHDPKPVLDAVSEQLGRSLAIGAQHRGEAELAERLVEVVPCAELVCLCTTGSEAVHVALRIARAATGRRLILKFEGHYHGWLDPIAVATPGLPAADPDRPSPLPLDPMTGGQVAEGVLVCRWNDVRELEHVLGEHGAEVAAVILEPVASNGGLIEPAPGYLEEVRDLTHRVGALLVFDEVVTGFRLALGGAQDRYGVTPDLATFGKAIGSGFAVAAVAGRKAVMDEVVAGRVKHVGTFNGNPVALAAANAAVRTYQERSPALYHELEGRAGRLAEGLRGAASAAGVPLRVNQVGPLLQTFVAPDDLVIRSYADTLATDGAALGTLAESLLGRGVMVLPRGWWFLSAAHTDEDIEETITAAGGAFVDVAETLE